MRTANKEELEKLSDKELLERLEAVKKEKFERRVKPLVDEIDEIKEHGFSELEAIELLKVAELKKT